MRKKNKVTNKKPTPPKPNIYKNQKGYPCKRVAFHRKVSKNP